MKLRLKQNDYIALVLLFKLFFKKMLSNNGLYIKTSSNKSDDVCKKDNAFALLIAILALLSYRLEY